MDTRTQESLARDEVGSLISSSRVTGTEVYNPKGDHLGTVEHVMIDKLSGQVGYAVMSFGGFLGIGEKYHPLPWAVLDYDVAKGGYVVDLDKKTLEGAPYYGDTSDPYDWADRGWRSRVDKYYQPFL
ncbi:MAG: PRC-barrel domain-containing protein [Alphaproteobacteria bacterium]